jgi:hypothetical protein
MGKSKRPDSFGRSGGGEVDGDTADREIEATVLECGAHSLTAFADFEIGQADD